MRIGLLSAKGSPGVTTTAVALAAAGGGVLVEMDPAGGGLECWAGPQGEPGLIRVASALRHANEPTGVLNAHAVEVWPGVRAVLAPTGGETAESTLVAISERLTPALQEFAELVVVDGGRWSRSQATARRLSGSDVVVVVVSPTLAGIEHARWLVDPVADMYGVPVVAVPVGDRPYPPAEVASVLGVPVPGVVAWDPRGVHALLTAGTSRSWSRSSLARSVRSVIESLDRLVTGAVVVGE